MPWSSGSFTRSNGVYSGPSVWSNDATANINIIAARHDTHDKDLADGINACLNIDGQNAMRANLPFGGYKATGMAAGTANTDAANVGQVVTSVSYNSGTRVLTLGRTVAGALTVTFPVTAAGVAGLFALPSVSTGGFMRDDGVFAAPGAAGFIKWNTASGPTTMVPGTAYRVAGAYAMTVPTAFAANDLFIVHAASGACSVVMNGATLTAGGQTAATGVDTLTLQDGETVYLLATSATELRIL